MSANTDRALAIQLDDGRVVVATPRPEDKDQLGGLEQDIVLLTASGDYDTSAHGISDEVTLDVEGHAITLRLPTSADAEAVRRAVAVGAVTATIVAAGAIAALQGTGGPATSEAAAPAAPAAAPMAAPAPVRDPALLNEERLAARDPMWTESTGGVPADMESGPSNADTHGPGRGELERP